MNVFFSFVFLLVVSFNIQAKNILYSVQLQAAKSPDLSNYKKLSKFGKTYIEKVSVDLNRVKIGLFRSRSDAETALYSIRSKGFSDAFITRFTGNTMPFTKNKSKVVLSKKAGNKTNTNTPKKTISWSSLTDEQKNDVVYVDNVLHLQHDGEFIPLTGYKKR